MNEPGGFWYVPDPDSGRTVAYDPCAFCGLPLPPWANVRQTNPYDPLNSKTMHVRCYHLYTGTRNPFDAPIPPAKKPWWKRLLNGVFR